MAWGRDQQIRAALVGFLFLSASSSATFALDASDLAPCRPAAARFCDRSEGMTWSNLLRCGATLAAHSFPIAGYADLPRPARSAGWGSARDLEHDPEKWIPVSEKIMLNERI
jgi:hypothetical protein